MNSSPFLNALTNRCIVLHLVKSGPASFDELFDTFGRSDVLDEDTAKAKFRKRLEHLLNVNRIVSAPGGKHGNRMFAPGPEALTPVRVISPKSAHRPAPEPKAPKPTKPKACPKRYGELQSAFSTGQVVPMRQVDVMHGPVYVPPRTQFYRQGAMDFQSIPSRGHRC